jgi:hypothetical protein
MPSAEWSLVDHHQPDMGIARRVTVNVPQQIMKHAGVAVIERSAAVDRTRPNEASRELVFGGLSRMRSIKQGRMAGAILSHGGARVVSSKMRAHITLLL